MDILFGLVQEHVLWPTLKRLQLIDQPNGNLWVDFYFKLNVHASLEFQINCLSPNLIGVSYLIYILRSRALDLNSYILILILVNIFRYINSMNSEVGSRLSLWIFSRKFLFLKI